MTQNHDKSTTILDQLIRIADAREGTPLHLAQQMIGPGELALLIAKEALKHTSLSVRPVYLARVLRMTESGATKRIDNTAVRES